MLKNSKKRIGGRKLANFINMPGHLLRRCHQISVAIFLDECQAFDLTPLQFSVLAALSSYGALDKATLSRVAALDRTTVSVVLKNLQERGFVASRASDQDRRATLNDITEDGLATLRAAQSDVVRAQERMLAPLNEDERVEFLRLLAKMADANNMFSRAPQRTPKA